MRTWITIALIVLAAGVINLPAIYRPRINFNLLGRQVFRDLDLKLGLDLRGGVHLVYEADTATLPESDRAPAVEATRSNIERRINSLGVSEPIIQTAKVGSDYRLIVELAGVTDINQAISLIGQTALLEFKESNVATPASALDFITTGLTGRDLQLAQVQFDSGKTAGQPVVAIEFNPEGAKNLPRLPAEIWAVPWLFFSMAN